MITAEESVVMKAIIPGFNNPIFQNYLKKEMTPNHRCPCCDEGFENYIEFRHHVLTKHYEESQTENIQELLDPVHVCRVNCGTQGELEPLTMGKFFGDIISSAHNQHALINLIGKTGMGKSNAAMRIGVEVSKYLALKLGGTPNDYFNITNVAIMKLDSIIPIIETLDKKKYNVIILDDIGASYSARDFQKAINKNINKIFQTFRDTNTLVILTMPDTFLIDKVARKLAHFQIEMTEKRHDQGVSIGKLVQLVEQYRGSGKTHFHFIVDENGVKYKRILFKRVDSALADEYEKKREEIRKDMMQNSINAIVQCGNTDEGEKTQSLNDLPTYQRYASEVSAELSINPRISCRALSLKLKTVYGVEMSKDTAGRAIAYVQSLNRKKAERIEEDEE